MDPSESAANKAESTSGEKYIPRIYDTNQLEKIPFPTDEGLRMEVIAEINYCEADDKYTFIYTIYKDRFVVVKPLGEVYSMLPSKTFYRSNDKYVVNGNQIYEYLKSEKEIVFENGVILEVSKRKEEGFLAFLHSAYKKINVLKSFFTRKSKKPVPLTPIKRPLTPNNRPLKE